MTANWLRDSLMENWGLKLVSLLTAFLIWFFVVGQERREEYFKVRLILAGTPEELTITSRVPEFISVRLVGPRAILTNVRSRLLSISLDLKGMQEGTSTYEVLPSRLGLPRGVEIADISPSVVTLQADRKMKKSLKVKPRLTGSPAAGYELVSVASRPDSVLVEGAEKPLKQAKEVTTEMIDVSGLEGSMSRPVNLAPQDPSFRTLSAKEQVMVDVIVRELKGERGFLQVLVRPPEAGTIIKPSTVAVKLSGNLSVLSRLTAKDIQAKAEISGEVKVTAPEGAEVVGVTPPSVQVYQGN